jgi:ABC-2 type transport system ATP-binding protein
MTNKHSLIVARLERVRVSFDSHTSFALAGTSLEVRRGEILGLIGPAGSGKSTVLRLLAGQIRPTEGQVKVFDRSPRRAAVKARVGYLSQFSARPMQTGLRRLIHQLIKSKPISKLPNELRFAQLLLRRPAILLLDDPFEGLDSAARFEMMRRMGEFAAAGNTVLLATRTLEFAMDVCRRFAICFRGQIEAVASLPELLASSNGIRIVGPVLPNEIAGRTLQTIRSELRVDTVSVAPAMATSEGIPTKSNSANQVQMRKEPAKEDILAKLTKPQNQSRAKA